MKNSEGWEIFDPRFRSTEADFPICVLPSLGRAVGAGESLGNLTVGLNCLIYPLISLGEIYLYRLGEIARK